MNKSLVLALTVTALAASSAAAGVTVSGPFIDDQTGGDWRGAYGSCFYLVPDAFAERTLDTLGPDFFRGHQEQYRYNTCYGGPLYKANPAQTRVDWRIFRNSVDLPDVSTWEATEIVPGSAQWNPCLQKFHHTTWSNESFGADPLTVEMKLSLQGSATIAYYFVNASNKCRESQVSLLVDGVEMASGTVGDFAVGKYLVFQLDGLKDNNPAGTVVTLEVSDLPGDASCGDTDALPGRTTHVSGIFVDPGADPTSNTCNGISGKPLK